MSNSSKTRAVVVSVPELTTRDGQKHTSGARLTLPDVEARDLIRAGAVHEPAKATKTEKGA